MAFAVNKSPHFQPAKVPDNIYVVKKSTIPARYFVAAFFVFSLLLIYVIYSSGIQINWPVFELDIWKGLPF